MWKRLLQIGTGMLFIVSIIGHWRLKPRVSTSGYRIWAANGVPSDD